MSNNFSLEDFGRQLDQVQATDLGDLMKTLATMPNVKLELNDPLKSFGQISQMIAAMTAEERSDPAKVDHAARTRIASAAGCEPQDVENFLAIFQQVQALTSSAPTIGFQGGSVKLRKRYRNYDSYKNDPNNLAPGEASKVQKLIQSAPIANHFASYEEMLSATGNLKFPGYGMMSSAGRPQPDGSTLSLFIIEIPKSGNGRHIVFRGADGKHTLIDDFVFAETAFIDNVSLIEGKLVYSTWQGTKVLERTPLPSHPESSEKKK